MELEYTAQRIMNRAFKPVNDLSLFIVPDFLSPVLLKKIKENWPTENWRDNGRLNSQRRQFRVNKSNNNFWDKIQLDFIESKTISYVIHNLFNQLPRYREILTDLWEDSEGYAVGQHIDNPRINILCQIYLAESLEQVKHGAKICTKEGEVIYEVPMYTNLCWIALNTDNMYHKVDPYTLAIPRRSLMFRYMNY
jgi:hypothetical protein